MLLLDVPVTISRGTKDEYWDSLEIKETSVPNVAALRRKVPSLTGAGSHCLLFATTYPSPAQTVTIENHQALSKPSNSDICVRPECHYFAHYKTPLNYILSPMNPVHLLPPYLLQLIKLQ